MNCRSEVWICLGLLIIYSELNFWNYMYIFYPELHFWPIWQNDIYFLYILLSYFSYLRNYFKVYWATLINAVYIYIWNYSLLTNLMKTCVLCEGLNFVVIFSDFEEWPIVIQRKKALCLLLHQPSLFKTAIWWNVIPIAGPENVNHCQIYFLISAL